MKADLDRLMAERDYAALLVFGGTAQSPAMYYLTSGASIGETTVLVKPAGRPAVLFANPMERDEAAKSGLTVRLGNEFDYPGILREAQGRRVVAYSRFVGKMLAAAGVTAARVAVAGHLDVGAAYELLGTLGRELPEVELVGEFDNSVLSEARLTKDAAEAKRIRAVGRKTMQVVAGTQEFLTSHRARGGCLVKKDGSPLTIGDVKARIRHLLTEQGVVDVENGTIFAIGEDAGVPHSRGNPRDPIMLGKTIIFDIFPAEPGGGYFFDFTRTWCLGYAPPEVEQAYADVLSTFRAVMRALKPGELCRSYQALACDLLEARGHATTRSNPRTTNGYVHSLAHGVGLEIHEAPGFQLLESNNTRLEPGMVITVEPGVYYPERGYGVRLEDCVWLNPASLKFETLASYAKDLVLPVKGVPGKR